MSGVNKATKKPIDQPAPEVEPKPAPAATRGIDVELWRKSMERLQRLFERAALMHERLTSHVIVAPTRGDYRRGFRLVGRYDQPPDVRDAGETCAEVMGLLSESPGSAVITQTWHCHFVGSDRSMELLAELAADATKLLRDLSDRASERPGGPVCVPGLPLNARNVEKNEIPLWGLDGWQDAGRWMLLVHELAWTQARGSPLHSLRWMWSGENMTPYYSDEQAREAVADTSWGCSYGAKLDADNRVQAFRWASSISGDQFAASSHAIEAVLAMTSSDRTAAGEPLTPNEEAVWNCLANRCLLAKEISNELGIPAESVRRCIREMREKGRSIPNLRSRGYYREDAQPPAFLAP